MQLTFYKGRPTSYWTSSSQWLKHHQTQTSMTEKIGPQWSHRTLEIIFTQYHPTDLFVAFGINSKNWLKYSLKCINVFFMHLCCFAEHIFQTRIPVRDSNISITLVSNYDANSPIRPVHVWTSYQIRKIADCACVGNAGSVFTATDFKGNRQLAIPARITVRASGPDT